MAETAAQEFRSSGVLGGSMGMYILSAIQKLVDVWLNRYRPELHYMRGPGPKWQERHADTHAGLAD
jgi:hypothetical protein